MEERIWTQELGDGPIVAVAVHDGAEIRTELLDLLALDAPARLREEDPFTGEWTAVAGTRVVGTRSRFEVDLNRPREKAVYLTPDDAWGLRVWKDGLPDPMLADSLAAYDAFYDNLREILAGVQERHGRFVVLDLHSYNHRRDGADAPAAPADANPQVNVGTGTMVRRRWAPVIERFISDLGAYPFPGGPLDVRENVRFRGGRIPAWIHQTFPETGCALAVEFKKFFMDEWTGEPDGTMIDAIGEALRATVPGLTEVLESMGRETDLSSTMSE